MNINIYRLVFLVVIASAAIGCHRIPPVSSGVGVESITNETPPATYLRVDNPELVEKVTITDVKHRLQNNLLNVNVEVSSQYEKTLRLQYHFTWFDENGFVVESDKSPWKPLMLHGYQSLTLQGVAPASNVTSFTLYIRPASSNAYHH